MSGQLSSSLERLARSNPARADDDRGSQAAAQAVLAKILATERRPVARPRRRRSPRLMIIAFAALLLVGGAAVAATDPFGFWRSTSPDSAMYGVDGSRHVRTPTAQEIGCRRSTAVTFTCGASVAGQRYELTDTIPAATTLTRAKMLKALKEAARRGELSALQERRIRADLAAVPDSFLAGFSAAMRFGTIAGGSDDGRVPPAGVPKWLVCKQAGAAISCRDLNGDERVAIGSSIYMAIPASDWVRARTSSPNPPLGTIDRMWKAILGGPPTRAELRLMRDMLVGTHTSGSASSSQPIRAQSSH